MRKLSMALALGILVWQGAAQDAVDSSLRPGRLFVEFVAEDVEVVQGKTGLTVFDKAAERFGVRSVRKAFPFLDVVAEHRTLTPQMESLRRIYAVEHSVRYSSARVAGALARDPAVLLAEPQLTYRPIGQSPATPNDPQYGRQTHLAQISLPKAWDVAKGEQSDVVVAIVDSGIHWQHEDLRENIWTNPNEIPDNGIDDDNNGFVDDVNGWNFTTDEPDAYGDGSYAEHGTIVAGIASAVTDNGLGIAGAAWNAKLIPVSAACEDGRDLCETLSGVVYAALMGADVVNCSFGGTTYSVVAHRVFEAAFAEGTLAVAASGNDGVNMDEKPHYPSAYAVTLSVGGIGKTSDQNQYNYGRSVNVFAPGVRVNALGPGNAYYSASGTSVAAPLVTGVAALVKTAFPAYTPGQIREQIRLTAQNIDAAQAFGRDGEFGRGRVDAFRAVTEQSGIAIRLVDLDFENQNGSRDTRTGDVVTVQATFTNFFGNASAATVGVNSDAAYVEFARREVTGVQLARGETATYDFSFTLKDGAPDNQIVLFHTEIGEGAFSDTPDVFTIPINQTLTATHHTSALRVSITGEGNIGYTAFQGDIQGQGVGFRPLDADGNERDPLFEGGLLIATGPNRVSSSIRGVASTDQDDHFAIPDGESMRIAVPGSVTAQEGRLVLTDAKAHNPIGVRILQESYVDHAAGHEDFVVLKYTVTNESSQPVSELHLGLFFDWDVDKVDVNKDQARFSGTQSTGWVTDQTGSVHVGIRLLTQSELLNYRAIDNPDEIYDGYTPREKWEHMSNGLIQAELGGTDVSQIMASGPYAVASGESVEMAFAMVAGTSAQDYLQNADKALELWDKVINAPTSAETPDLPRGWAIMTPYPNPTRGAVTIDYMAPPGGTASIEVFDMLGRRMAVLADRMPAANLQSATWDSRDMNGQVLVPGIYLIRLTGSSGLQTHTRTRPLVVVR